MRIAIDVTPTITGTTGIARYVHGLTGALGRASEQVDLRRFAVGRAQVPVGADVRQLGIPLRIVARSWWRGGPPRVERLVGPIDTVHASGPVLPSSRSPIVAVVYDVAALDRPDLHPPRSVEQMRHYVAALPEAAVVVTISQAIADRLTASVPSDRIHITPLGRTEVADVEPPSLSARRYVLAVGAPVPRKAYHEVLHALAALDREDLALAVVGPSGSEDVRLARLASELGMAERYHRAGHVTDSELAGWYASAAVLAAPSVDEGFGLPIIEAQGWGCPVVASDVAAHREVTGGAATLVPVGDTPALAAAIEAAAQRGDAVEQMVRDGRTNAARYTWEACAAATLAAHRQAIGR